MLSLMKRSFLVLLVLAGLLAVGAPSARGSTSAISVLVVKATWGPQPYTDAAVDTTMKAVESFYATASFGQVTMTYAQTPWLDVLPLSGVLNVAGVPPCWADPGALPGLLPPLAVAAGWNLAEYSRIVYVLPGSSGGCSGGFFNVPNEVFLDGFLVGTVVHELRPLVRHGARRDTACWTTLGQRTCAPDSYGDPYGDPWDVMGGDGGVSVIGQVGDAGAIQKARAGWLTPTYIGTPGIYRLAPLEQASALPQALVIRAGSFEYWVDHREAVGNDAHLAGTDASDVTSGFEVHRITGDPFAPGAEGLTPDYLIPTGKTTSYYGYYTAPGKTFAVSGVFALGAVSDADGIMTVRFRWLDTTKPTAPTIVAPSATSLVFTPSSDDGSGIGGYLLTVDEGTPQSIPGPSLPPSGTAVAPPSTVTVDAAAAHAGQHTITLVAVDRAGNRSAPATAVIP